jgi:Baseplate J-like protein
MTPKNRKSQVTQSTTWNGIDFVEVANDAQTALRVHFLNGVSLETPVTPPTISGGEAIPTVALEAISAADWEFDADGHLLLDLFVAAPGDFSSYTLTLASPNLDPFFASAEFSFKDRCPTSLDCRATEPPCPAPDVDRPPIDYLAKDFLSFRQALLDFSALRYPEWQERSEADFGVMFAEALSGMADDLSYLQDRVAGESALETATQRRSLVRLARMVDYEPQRATAATAMLQFDVASGVTAIAHGLAVSAPGPDGTPLVFETGHGLTDRLIDPATGLRRATPPTSSANPKWNAGAIHPYWLDDSQRCLPAGATSMQVLGHGYDFESGQSLLITTAGATSADPPTCQIVRLIAASGSQLPATETFDPLFTMPPTAYTTIVWTAGLAVECDLTVTTLCGNLVPATQGQTVAEELFVIGAGIVRTGPSALPEARGCGVVAPTPQYLHGLRNADRLAWITPDGVAPDANPVPTDPTSAPLRLPGSTPPLPELLLEQVSGPAPPPWVFSRTLLDATRFDAAFTLDEARYQPITPTSDGSMQYEYAGDSGDTLRFGDGTFGAIPLEGTQFRVTYRVGGGANGNVAAGAISQIEPSAAGELIAVTNPLAARGGADAETSTSVRRFAPQKFRQVQFRAVIPKDYENAAQTLPWVTRAGSTSRWTGSWLTLFTTPDPRGSETVTLPQQTELIDLLNRYRMAGYESYVPAPQFVSLDIDVEVCANEDAFRGDVETAVLAELSPKFFNPDQFTFGDPLERSRLEAAVQSAAGVAGVLCINYRNRSRSQVYLEMPDEVTVGTNQIIRCDNDRSLPEHGSVQITVRGGK